MTIRNKIKCIYLANYGRMSFPMYSTHLLVFERAHKRPIKHIYIYIDWSPYSKSKANSFRN